MLPGPKAFQAMLMSIMVKIADDDFEIDRYKERLDELQKKEDRGSIDGIEEQRAQLEAQLGRRQASIKVLDQFHSDIVRVWGLEKLRIIGHVAYAPPITVGVGAKRYTEDWALIEVDHDKIDRANFRGNVIDLDMEITLGKFMSMMYSDPPSFEYPFDRLLPVEGVVPEDELIRPQTHDADGEPCIPLIKNGCATKTTVARGTGIKSFVRDYFPDGTDHTSMELAIVGHDERGGFSKDGDSGAIIVDGQGRVAALLTGGSGLTESKDITYGTPFEWLFERIKDKFPDAQLYPSTV